jgi:chromate transport protein ChrA
MDKNNNMREGIYKAKNRWREFYDTRSITNNVQICVALLAFALFIITMLSPHIWRLWKMSWGELNLAEWLAFILGGILLIGVAIIAIWSLVSFVILVFRGWRGHKVQYNPETEEPNVLEAITPIDTNQNIASTKSDKLKVTDNGTTIILAGVVVLALLRSIWTKRKRQRKHDKQGKPE